MVVGAIVPMVVWGLVAWVALHGPIGHRTSVPMGPRGGTTSGTTR
jgi:hypothetical protein